MGPNAERNGLSTKRLRGAEWISRAVAPRHNPAWARIRDRRHEALEFGAVDQLFVREAMQAQLINASTESIELLLVLGNQYLSMTLKATIIIDKLSDPLPNRHGEYRDRDFGQIARELAHAPGIDSGGMAARVVLLEQCHLEPAHRKVQRGRAPVN